MAAHPRKVDPKGERMTLRSLIMAVFLTGCAFSVFSQTDTIRLRDVEINDTRVSSLFPVSRPAFAFDQVSLTRIPGGSFQELMMLVPGFDIRQRGVNGAQADVSVRGGSFEQTLVLLDGIRMNDPQTGHHNLDLPVDQDHIRRVEFLQGPGARIFGANAFSGAVNFITPEELGNSLRITLTGGDFGLFSGAASGNFHTGKFSHFLSAGGKHCQGYTANTDFGEVKTYYHGWLNQGNNKMEVQAAYLEKAFGANSFYSAKYPNQFEKTRMELLALKGHFGDRLKWAPVLSWKRHHDHFELFRENPPSWYAGHNYHMTDVLAAGLDLTLETGAGRFAGGAEYRFEHIFSNVLGERLAEQVTVPGEVGQFFTRSAERTLLSIFFDYRLTKKRFTLSTGMLLHYSANFGPGVYPGLEASCRIFPGADWYLAANRALRAPSFTDLYYQGPVNVGNPQLKPEESWEFETGMKFRKGRISGNLGAFLRKGYHLIDWIRHEGESVWHSENLTRINTFGPEINVSFFPVGAPDSGFFIRRISLAYQMIFSEKPQTDFISYYVMDYLRHKVTLQITHRIWRGFFGSWGLILQDRAGSFTDAGTGQEVPYEPAFLASVRLGWDRGPAGFYLGIENIFDVEYRDFGSVEMPGRWTCAGFSLNIQ